MAVYADTSDFALYGLHPNITGSEPNAVTSDQIEAHLAAASDDAEGSILARSDLPIEGPPYPRRLVQAVCQVAAYSIMSSLIGWNPADPLNKSIAMLADAAQKWLHDIKVGRLTPTWLVVAPQTLAASDPPRDIYPPLDSDAAGEIA